MPKEFADVEVSTSIDLRNLRARLLPDEVAVLDNRAKLMLADIDAVWRGWKYAGVPVRARGRSQAGWRHTVQATEGFRSITLLNRARSFYGKRPYVGFIHRSGTATLEADKVLRAVTTKHLPLMKAELSRVLLDNIGRHGSPKKLPRNKNTQYSTLTLEG